MAILYGADDRAYALVPVAVQTAAFSPLANSFVPVSTAAGAVTVTLPLAPNDRTVIGVKLVAAGNTLTIATGGGSDVFDVSGGATSITISTLDQAVLLQYWAAGAIWYQVANYSSGGGGGGVTSFNTRTGAVVPASGDYSFSEISGTATAAQLPAATTSAEGILELTQDLGGTATAPKVIGLQGVAITLTEANLVADLNNANSRSASATLLPGEETIFTGSTSGQTLTLPSSTAAVSSSVNTITNTASVSVTIAAGSGTTINNFGTSGSITVPSGYTYALVYIGTTWDVQSSGPSDFAKTNMLSIANGGTGAATAQAAINALAGGVTSGDYLRGNGTNVLLSAIQAGDLPLASGSAAGAVSTGSQTFAGVKTFNSVPTIPAPATLSAFAPVTSSGSTTVTGVTVLTVLASGLTVPASGLAQGQIYRFKAWGSLSTTVDTQTFTIGLYWGGITGTLLLSWGAQEPSGTSTATGASWLADFDIVANSATSLAVSGWDGLDFYFTSETQGATTVANTSGEQFVIGVTPSASAETIVCGGYFCERRA